MLRKFRNLFIKVILRTSSPFKRAKLIRRFLGITVGDNCYIYPGVEFGSEPYLIKIGNNVRVTNGVKFVTHDGGVWVLRNNGMLENADLFGEIEIGNNVHIGIGAIIMPGITIGDNVIIGAGAIVTKDIPSNVVAAGVPAKIIKSINEYYEKNKEHAVFTKNMGAKEKKEFLINKYLIRKG